MLPADTISVSIAQEWRALYEQIWRSEFFAAWASGLAKANLRQVGEHWLADGPQGPVTIRFSPHNGFGVMDHWVEMEGGKILHIPLRIVANGDGAEVLLTLYRQLDMDDAAWAGDREWVRRDIARLKALAES